MTTTLDAARMYVAFGYAPVPVPHRSKNPGFNGWQKLRLKDEELPGRFPDDSNIGLILGEASGGLVDVDLDCREAIELADWYLPETGAVFGRPGKPRSHRLYVAAGAEGKPYRDEIPGPDGKKPMLVEIRSTGQQTIVWPSLHDLTGELIGEITGDPAIVSADELKKCVDALYLATMKARHPDWEPGPTRPAPMPEPHLNGAAPSRAVSDDEAYRRASAYLAKMEPSVSGSGGHDRAYAAATVVVYGFDLGREVGFNLLMSEFNPRCQPPWSEHEMRHKVEDADTKPHTKPRGWLRNARGDDWVRILASAQSVDPDASTGSSEQNPPTVGSIGKAPVKAFNLTDLGNAERLAGKYAGTIRYCHERGKWYVWSGTRWQLDTEGLPAQYAAAIARGLLAEAAKTDDPDKRSALAKWGLASENRTRLDAIVAIAKSRPELVVQAKDLDADPWSLNCLNGTVNLRDGTLRPHAKDDLNTRLAPVNYDHAADCPIFEAFLDRIFAGDKDLIGFVQRWIGYSLTGDITQQKLPIFYGVGANGKSVLLDTVMAIMGDYASPAPPNLLVKTGYQDHPTEIADLMGRRLVAASESEDGAALKIQLVKRLTGDQVLKARWMQGNYFSFQRTHKLILVTNNKPRVKEDSEAVWRRLFLVNFGVVIPTDQRDPRLLERLQAEWPGILAWMVRGCLDWQMGGLGQPPTSVVTATDANRASEDTVGKFIEERCDLVPEHYAIWSELFKAYRAWAEDAGERPMSSMSFAEYLTKHGVTSETRRIGRKTVKVRVGISVRQDVDEMSPFDVR